MLGMTVKIKAKWGGVAVIAGGYLDEDEVTLSIEGPRGLYCTYGNRIFTPAGARELAEALNMAADEAEKVLKEMNGPSNDHLPGPQSKKKKKGG